MDNTQKEAYISLIYKENGETRPTTPKNKKTFALSELQAIVNGYIEIVRLTDNKLMILNEEGKINDKCVPNSKATEIFRKANGGDLVIYGNVLVCNEDLIDD